MKRSYRNYSIFNMKIYKKYTKFYIYKHILMNYKRKKIIQFCISITEKWKRISVIQLLFNYSIILNSIFSK